MNVRLKKLQSETFKLITDNADSSAGGITPHALSRFNFKERLTSPKNEGS